MTKDMLDYIESD